MVYKNFAEKNKAYEENINLNFKYPTLSKITGKDIRNYKISAESRYMEWCPVCEIQYSKRKYQECPLCKTNNENIDLKKKMDDIEESTARKERQYIEYIDEILRYNKEIHEQNDSKVKKTVVTLGRYRGFPINWLILCTDRMNGKVLLISEKTLDLVQYNERFENVAWKDCTLRKWLNERFFNIAFSKYEKKIIKLTKVVNSVGQNTKNKCTEDFVFCLTVDEAKGYFVKDSYRSALGIGGEASRWWLRNFGDGKVSADVNFDGTIDESGCQVTDLCSVRPALWVDMSYVEG